MSEAAEQEQGWLADYLYRDGRLESGLAMFANAAGTITRFSADASDLATARRMPGRAILPGMVNAHSHAFQRVIRGRTEQRTAASKAHKPPGGASDKMRPRPSASRRFQSGGTQRTWPGPESLLCTGFPRDSFWTWRELMYHAAGRLSPEELFVVSRMAFTEMLKAGITTAGEFHYLHHQADGTRYADPNLLAMTVARAAAESGIRLALLRSAYARAGWQVEANPQQARFITRDPEQFLSDTEALKAALSRFWMPDQVWAGVAPHSIRAVPLSYLLAVAEYARVHSLPLHMHVAEQPAEIDACVAEYGLRPVELLARHGLLDMQFTAVHATHTSPREIYLLAAANICACPLTERNLGDGVAPADRWAEAEVNVCLGSDSNAEIDLLAEARGLEYHLRLERLERAILPAEGLFRNATAGGARSLQAPGGELREGFPADFFVVDLNHPSIAGADAETLLANIVFALQPGGISEVYVGGEALVQAGRLPEEREVIDDFQAVMKKLWNA